MKCRDDYPTYLVNLHSKSPENSRRWMMASSGQYKRKVFLQLSIHISIYVNDIQSGVRAWTLEKIDIDCWECFEGAAKWDRLFCLHLHEKSIPDMGLFQFTSFLGGGIYIHSEKFECQAHVHELVFEIYYRYPTSSPCVSVKTSAAQIWKKWCPIS